MKLCKKLPEILRFPFLRFLAAAVSLGILLSAICGTFRSFVLAEEPAGKMAVLLSEQEGSSLCVIPSLTPGESYSFALYYVSEAHVYDPIKILYEVDKNHTMARIDNASITNEVQWYRYTCDFTVPNDGYTTGTTTKKVNNVLLSVSMGAVGNTSRIYGLSLTKSGAPDENLLKYPDFSKNFSSYYIYDENFDYATRIAGSKTKDTLGGCSLADADMSVFEVPASEQKPGKMAELTCPFPSASFCTAVDLTPGKTYVFSVYYNSESSVAEPIKIFYKGSSAQWGLYQKLNINGDDISDIYRYYVYEFKVPTNGTIENNKTSVLFSVSMGTIGKKTWIYDLRLTEKEDTEENNIFENPLFETNFSGYRYYNSTYTNYTDGPADSDVFSYDYYGMISESTLLSVSMARFEKPVPYESERMVKIVCPDAGGWFLVSAKVDVNREYEATLSVRSRYYMSDLIGVFYEDTARNLKRISDATVTEDAKKYEYSVQFKTPETGAFLQGDKINVFVGVNLSYSGTVPGDKAKNQIYLYDPVLKEKDSDETENIFKDPYFKRCFTYCTSLSKNLKSRVAGPIDTAVWDSFELVDTAETDFNKNAEDKMAKLVCPYWSAYFVSKARILPGETYVFALDYFTEADMEEPIILLYGGDASVGYSIQPITEFVMTEDADKDRYFYEFEVPEDALVSNGTVQFYCNIVMGEINNVVYVDNLSLRKVDDEESVNLIINPGFDSNFYGYYIYNHEYNTASSGPSDAGVNFGGTSAILDRDESLFTKPESAKIIGTDWALEFGEIRKKSFLIDNRDDEDDSPEETPVIEETYPTESDFIIDIPTDVTDPEDIDSYEDLSEKAGTGNVKKVKRVRVVEEYDDTTWIVVAGVSAGGIIAAGAVTFIIIRKRKKKG